MADIILPYQWTPRPYQERLWNYLASGGKRASACWHRRAGKDEVCLHHTACASQERVGGYWHLLPEYGQARKAIWEAVNPHTGKRRIDEAFPMAMRETTREQEMFIKFKNGSTWQLAGSDNYNSLVGSSPCGLVFSEYALANPAAWAYLRPILRENNGWALFITTPRGKNHFYELHTKTAKNEGWFVETLTNDDTGRFTAIEMAEELAELQSDHGEQYGHSVFMQEYFCSFDAAIPGAIWADCVDRAQREGRILPLTCLPSAPVFTAWDLGRTDDTSIWWYQLVGTQIEILDHFSASGMDIDNPDEPKKGLVQVLLDRQRHHGCTYGTHWLPHDARPRTLAAGGKSILQQFHDAARRHESLGRFAIVARLDMQEGIAAARKTFPRCRFDVTRCQTGLEALKHYHREWDAENKIFLDHPHHDWSSHPSDAFRYLSLSWKLASPRQPDSPLMDKLHAGNPVTQTFGYHKSKHLRRKAAQREYASA